MTWEPDYPDTLEEALGELHTASRAGVFEQTPVDTRQLLDTSLAPTWVSMLRRARVWVPLAAAAVLAIGVWGAMFSHQIASIRSRQQFLDRGTSSAGSAVGDTISVTFAGCQAGPGVVVLSGCRTHDYDADGDVDLADFGTYQLAYAASRRQ